MKLMLFPVTMIEEFPHFLLHFNFTTKKDRYFLSPYEAEITKHGSQRAVCDIIYSSDFLCALLDIDRPAIMKQNSPSTTSPGPVTTTTATDSNSTANNEGANNQRSSSTSTNLNDTLLTLIQQKLDFKHRCMFYSTGPTSDLCGKMICFLKFFYNSFMTPRTFDETVGKNLSHYDKMKVNILFFYL